MTDEPTAYKPLGRELVEYVDAHLDRTMDRLQKGNDPIWQAQAEMGRTIVTMSSSALILSISVVQFLAARLPDPRWPLVLPISWILFGAAILLGALRSSWQAKLRHFEPCSKAGDLRFGRAYGSWKEARTTPRESMTYLAAS